METESHKQEITRLAKAHATWKRKAEGELGSSSRETRSIKKQGKA